ncbi:MAG: SDR family oxidoreductase [Comamonadaceae bacterium]|nr:MAG: SDR family oxidoreductase [Comamonadaceae bacterium]
MTRPELWAGPECTVNRVGDDFHDQLEASGFGARPGDIGRLAGLGITRMRFPLLWERTERRRGHLDWTWPDTALRQLAEAGVKPVAGLVHHGSGPAWTNLLDPAFPELLAAYAALAAQRYPDIECWTPVNEPLTTARFSGLYGHWYPHGTDDRSFVRALLNQVRGTVLAMREVRRVNPLAQLLQTEDVGIVTSTPALAYQAHFENLRRWLSFDLLCGRVGRTHDMWRYLRAGGATEQELDLLQAQPCPPDVFGVNSYITSARHLDDRTWLYPARVCGGNGIHRYADVEAVRVLGSLPGGFAQRLRETAGRYAGAVALTEVHLGCCRDEQLRWLAQAWDAAVTVRGEGHDVRAVTCWAVFGAVDWDSLVTRRDGHYEPGLWDVRSDPPRETALAGLARELAAGRTPAHPAVAAPGWWERADRLGYNAHGELVARPLSGRPLLIAGASGTLGQAFARICKARGLPFVMLTRSAMDVADPASVHAALEHWQPWAVINATGYVRVDDAESDSRQWRDNVTGPEVLARACSAAGIRLAGFSSDLVFDGLKGEPYVESDMPHPLNEYGRAKCEAERLMLSCALQPLVIRTAAFFGPWDPHNFLAAGLPALARGETWTAASDQVVSPTYVPDLARATLDLLIDGEQGLWHLANRGSVSWAGFAAMAAGAAGLDAALVQPAATSCLSQRALRPRQSALGSRRGQIMPTLDDALRRYIGESAAVARARGEAMLEASS